MMEGMNQMGQEEYIWAMRTSLYRESDSEMWKNRRATTMHIDVSQILPKKSISAVEDTTSDYQTKVMASLVPDEVILNVDDYSHRQYDACFLFGDVSGRQLGTIKGFTELCEKYTKTGVSGPSRMTQVLNKYLGAMVQEVLGHNGDVLKFSGDAFLTMFKQTEGVTMRDAVHEALDSALVIQKNYGSYKTDVDVIIRVKLAISTGPVMFSLIGDQKNSHYVVVGKPIWDVKAAEHISSAGDIIVAPAAWHYVNPSEYIFKDMPDGIHIRLLGVGPNWRSIQKNVRQQKHEQEALSLESDSTDSDDIEDAKHAGKEAADEFALRPVVNLAVRLKIKENLRKFIIAPVMKSIDMNEPFEYLTEMRQAVIVFINVISTKLETEGTVTLANNTYKIVCRVVDKMKGCVNKVSLFDKDLMFVVIFGLRGLKHELECQVALRCARECHDAINKLPGVLSTSIGVTTGKTYCGVFGHTLRREYTVISLIVNKAARLMVNYKDKVTCDRETFLHSKLEARNFVLQEYKPLKGISHPGPVYEFRGTELESDEHHKISARPFLGRSETLKCYSTMIEAVVASKKPNQQQHKMLVIKAEARQGKTRLLDELVYITPEEITVNRFTLRFRDSKIPYQTIRLIFNVPLSLTRDSSVREKEEKLLQALRNIQVPDLLCSLNNMFGVNFKNSHLYTSLSPKAKQSALQKLLKQLCYTCFKQLWVIAIDDADYMDPESAEIFTTFFEVKTLFLIATMAHGRIGFTENVRSIKSDPRVKILTLKPIERWFLGALACHILNVYAISPELENAIQVKSNGNPGWIESFLISMIQDEGLYILQASMRDINDLGLVAPPLYMMSRQSKEEAFKWQHIMEERRQKPTESDTELHQYHQWQKYIDSCRDSYMNVTIRELLESITTGGKVPVCIISPHFRVTDTEAELSIDAMILKTFDSLNFFEQLLIKCSAILGNQFLRDMLLYIMSATDKRKAALAVQKLFEIKVLACAKGDFLEGGTKLFKEKLLDPNQDKNFQCLCRGVRIEDNCTDLPKYASCGYLQFRSSLFREITYNLLTDNQKKEFHQRAIRYLEKETRKCKACGNGFFERILGARHDKEFIIVRDRAKKSEHEDTSSIDTASMSHRTSVHSTSTTISAGSTKKSDVFEKGTKSIVSFGSSPLVEKVDKKFDATCGFTLIHRLKNSFSLTRAFSTEDFADCQCFLILSTTYAQLVDHCTGADDLTKQIEAMMEYAYVSILLCNIPLALKVLNEALQVLKQKSKEADVGNTWQESLIRGKIHTLIGYSQLELGHFKPAFKSLHRSLHEYGTKFPVSKLGKRLKSCGHEMKHFFGFFLFPRTLLKRLDHWETIFATNLAESLAHLCTLYIINNDWSNAKVAATWCLTKALQAYSNFQILCVASANMLLVSHHFKNWEMCIALEVHALKICHTKKTTMDAEDLKCASKLYAVIFFWRLERSYIDKCIHMGYTVLRMCTSIRAVQIILPVLPHLLHGLLMGKHFTNVHSILQELEYFYTEDSDASGKVWYLALSIGILLETGNTVVPYNVCENYYQMEGDTWVTIRDPDARKRFTTVMWLWCVRNEKWEQASIWCLKSDDFTVITEDDSIANKQTALYLLEGMILYLVSKLDKRNIQEVIKAEEEIKYLIKACEKAAKSCKLLMPRAVVKSCFGKELDPNLRHHIDSFKNGYLSLQISVTPNVDAVSFHIEDFCTKNQQSLGFFSEQAMESVHSDFELYHLKAYYKYVKSYDSTVSGLMKKAQKIAGKMGNQLELEWIEHSNKAWSRTLTPIQVENWKEHSDHDNYLDFQEIETSSGKLAFFTLPTPVYI